MTDPAPPVVVQNVSRKRLPSRLGPEAVRLVGAAYRFGRRRGAYRLEEGMTLRFVGDAEIRRLNRLYKHRDRATDVLAFATGDIIVSVDAARRQAAEMGHSLRRELLHLAVHGALHLAGWRDATDAARRRMDRETERILDGALPA